MKMVFMVLREVEATSATGGNQTSGSIRKKKPELTILTHSLRDLKSIMVAYKATMRDRERTGNSGYTLLPFTANDNGFVAPAVKDHIARYRGERRLPSQTPRTYTEILQEVRQESNEYCSTTL